MRYRVERALDTDRDLEAIFDFLTKSYVEFGESQTDAMVRAGKRLDAIERAMVALGEAPHQGTLCNEILPGLRAVTKQRAVFYFDVDDDQQLVRVLAIFFGGQDHRRAMLKRLLAED